MPDDFEAPLLALQKRIEELAAFPGDPVKEQEAQLKALSALPADTLVDGRYEKFRRMGKLGTEFIEAP